MGIQVGTALRAKSLAVDLANRHQGNGQQELIAQHGLGVDYVVDHPVIVALVCYEVLSEADAHGILEALQAPIAGLIELGLDDPGDHHPTGVTVHSQFGGYIAYERAALERPLGSRPYSDLSADSGFEIGDFEYEW